jgi:8-oxo-dGTP pyrophosphatase MutT (NUDIX family)
LTIFAENYSLSMEYSHFYDWLKTRLSQPLPGPVSQNKLTSLSRLRKLLELGIPGNARKGAVLLLLFPSDGKLSLVFMQRPEYNGVHSGQISFPGGKAERTDKSLIDTALRESKEEVGIEPTKVKILGTLTPLYIPPSNFHITPVVGFSIYTPLFNPDPEEVASIIIIPLDHFFMPDAIKTRSVRTGFGVSMQVPAFTFGESTIWGATAMVLNEFREIALEYPPFQ